MQLEGLAPFVLHLSRPNLFCSRHRVTCLGPLHLLTRENVQNTSSNRGAKSVFGTELVKHPPHVLSPQRFQLLQVSFPSPNLRNTSAFSFGRSQALGDSLCTLQGHMSLLVVVCLSWSGCLKGKANGKGPLQAFPCVKTEKWKLATPPAPPPPPPSKDVFGKKKQKCSWQCVFSLFKGTKDSSIKKSSFI